MRHLANWVSGFAILLSAAAVPATWAMSDDLDQAKALVEKQEYSAAQDALLKIDRKTLSETEAKEFDDLLEMLKSAVPGAQQAAGAFAEGERLIQDGKLSEADTWFKSVEGNQYSSKELRDKASERRRMIAEKQQLADAAKPKGPEAAPAGEKAAPMPDSPASTTQDPAAPATIIDEARAQDDLLWQRAEARAKAAIEAANKAVAEGRFDEARGFAAVAIQAIEANRQYAQPASKYENARKIALDAEASVNDNIRLAMDTKLAKDRDEVAARIKERTELLERQRREKVDQLLITGRQLAKEMRYAEAAEAMRQILALDPANAIALNNLDIFENEASLNDQKSLRNEAGRWAQKSLTEAAETLITWNADVLYPKNWLEISAKRDKMMTGTLDEDFELNSRLDEQQSEINFDDQPLEKVVDFIRDVNKLNIAVDWDDLEANGIMRDKPISLRLRDVSLRTVMGQILAQAGGDIRLGYAANSGLIRIASKEKLDRNKFIQVYDIRDLLVDIPKFVDAPNLDPGQAMADYRKPTGLFGTGPDLYDNGGNSESENSPSGPANKAEAAERARVSKLLDIIRATVASDSWREVGGGDGALRELNGNLIVYNTSDAHRQVRDLLSQLRETRALMIGVEARFLIVTSNFLEEIGVDLDFVFNSGDAGYDRAVNTTTGGPITDLFTGAPVLMPRQFGRAGIFPNVPAGGQPFTGGPVPAQPYSQAGFVPGPGGLSPSFNDMTPIGVSNGSLGLANPANLNTGIPGSIAQSSSFAPALNIAGSFLDNLQVDFLIRATQANKRSSIVQAPRLMMFNGQRAFVAVTRTRQYVSSVTAQVAEGAVAFQPNPQNIASGSSLDVEGTISADRKYVTITVRTGVAQEPQFERFEVQRASGSSPGLFVLLPDQEQRTVRTTVSVPDGGTVLLGGLKQVGEAEVEAGVPILSKIPILKRAFTNTSMVRDTQTLLILLKAKILIQQEAEEEAFPTFSSAN
ncbi:MAG: hypothetical protein IT450_10715 [Phycisphaerales bacterium]|nr:hypothetical protein [Phycisphaerales bacterium]